MVEGKPSIDGQRESLLFIGTQFSNLYTSVHTPTRGRVVVCLVFVIASKYALGHSQVSEAQPPNLRLIMPPPTLGLTRVRNTLETYQEHIRNTSDQ
jgi:hypothetical protein